MLTIEALIDHLQSIWTPDDGAICYLVKGPARRSAAIVGTNRRELLVMPHSWRRNVPSWVATIDCITPEQHKVQKLNLESGWRIEAHPDQMLQPCGPL